MNEVLICTACSSHCLPPSLYLSGAPAAFDSSVPTCGLNNEEKTQSDEVSSKTQVEDFFPHLTETYF
jgi:hypothetical protein